MGSPMGCRSRGTARGQEVPQRDAGKSAVRDTEKGQREGTARRELMGWQAFVDPFCGF